MKVETSANGLRDVAKVLATALPNVKLDQKVTLDSLDELAPLVRELAHQAGDLKITRLPQFNALVLLGAIVVDDRAVTPQEAKDLLNDIYKEAGVRWDLTF